MSKRREDIFWDLVAALDDSGLLPHVLIVGSWAEYLYRHHYGGAFDPNLRTHDIDVYYGNPFFEVPGASVLRDILRSRGFVAFENPGAGTSFFKEGVEVEFLTSAVGGSGFAEIPFTGVLAEKLGAMGMLVRMGVVARGYEIYVPTPASYAAHKLYINPDRNPASKRVKDIEAVRALVRFILAEPSERAALAEFLAKLPVDKRERIFAVADSNGIRLPSDS